MTTPSTPAAPDRLFNLGPGILAATSFAIGDVFSKVVFLAGSDVLSLSTFRSAFSVVCIALWLWFSPPPIPHTPRQRNISLAVGVLFAGIVYGLFKAIELMQVPVAILTYFIYPLLTGIAGALVVVAPLVVVYQYTPIESRGGPVPFQNLPALLVFTLLGNLFEEALFRGYVYGQLALKMAPIRAGIASGVVFAFCHIYLATTVTGIGYPLLAFTLWEGIIVGIVGAKSGVLPATLAHGGAIFLLSSGLI